MGPCCSWGDLVCLMFFLNELVLWSGIIKLKCFHQSKLYS